MAILGDHSLDQEPSPLITPGGAGCGLFTPHKTVEIGMESEQTLMVAAKAPKSSATQTHIQAHKNGSTFSKPSASQVHDAFEGAANKVKGKGKAKSDGSEGGGCVGCLVWAVIIFFVIGVFGAVIDDCDSCFDDFDRCASDFFGDDDEIGYSFAGPAAGEFLYGDEVAFFDASGEMRATSRYDFTESEKAYVDLNDNGEYDSGEAAYIFDYYTRTASGKNWYDSSDISWSDEYQCLFLDEDGDGEYNAVKESFVFYEQVRADMQNLGYHV